MIAPLAPYTLRGAIWYQGEANGSAGLEYRALLPRLIADWRKHWGAEFPFLIVQLPGWEHDTKPAELHDWPWLREAQLMTLKVPRTGMAVTIDIGDPGTVHPGDKLDVGLRLALAARKVAYGENIVASGPLYRDFAIEGASDPREVHRDRQRTRHRPSALAPKDTPPLPTGKLIGFTIAGEDHHWVEADAKIEGDTRPRLQPASAQARRRPLCLGELSALQSLQQGRSARVALPHRRLARCRRAGWELEVSQ